MIHIRSHGRMYPVALCLALLLACAPPAHGEDPAATKPSATKPTATKPAADASLDDELLKDLGGSPTKTKAPAAPPKSAKNNALKPSADSDLDDELLKDLGGKPTKPTKNEAKPNEGSGAPSRSGDHAQGSDPAAEVSRQMRQVESLLRRAKGTPPAGASDADQALGEQQQQIVAKLEALIDKLEQQQQQQSKSSSGKSSSSQSKSREKVSQPQTTSKSGSAPSPSNSDSSPDLVKQRTEKVDMAKMQDTLKDIWGQLPPRLREQMLQSGVEKFVPKYELLIEQYFKTLAEQQRGEAQ